MRGEKCSNNIVFILFPPFYTLTLPSNAISYCTQYNIKKKENIDLLSEPIKSLTFFAP